MKFSSRPNVRSVGFTIVELLIVIVVIGILATIAFIAYNGVSRQATVAVLQTDLVSASKQLKYDQVEASTYPTTTSAANGGAGLKASKGTTYQYTVDNNVSPQTFCLTATNGLVAYYITNDSAPLEGVCPGHTDPTVTVTGWTQISTGGSHSCGLYNNVAYCWGNNATGQLGVTSPSQSNVPIAVDMTGVMSGKTITKIVAGSNSTCAIASGNAYCWGSGTSGQLGNAASLNSSIPVAVSTAGVLSGKTITGISVGATHACVVASGNGYCWGSNGSGRLGNNSTSTSNVPVAVDTSGVLSGKTVTDISAGENFSCAVASGAAYCWGYNYGTNGSLGAGLTADSLVPAAVITSGALSGKTPTMIATSKVSSYRSCTVASALAFCWGNGNYGSVGNGGSGTTTSPSPVAVMTSGALSGKTVTAIAQGYAHTCVVASGAAYCWGSMSTGQVGNNVIDSSGAPSSVNNTPTAVNTSGVMSGKTIIGIDTGSVHTCAIASDQAFCWGSGANGRLGNNGTATSAVPVLVVNP